MCMSGSVCVGVNEFVYVWTGKLHTDGLLVKNAYFGFSLLIFVKIIH